MLTQDRHLPHRHVLMELTEADLMVQTATEQLRVHWTELREARFLRNFCVLHMRAGYEIPIPLPALSTEAVTMLKHRGSERRD